ncbi:hypothetical protein AB5J56_42225 [Streptomyces sp. R21]|uniref:Uncharacterized protein n=1 Tax=Streptomyces sp. R21 TaxID=3238627 RepID=A0AB39PLW7_9ACTN
MSEQENAEVPVLPLPPDDDGEFRGGQVLADDSAQPGTSPAPPPPPPPSGSG